MDKPVVLFVDDNEATCTLVTALLQSEFDVELAYDGLEAIEKLKSRHYAAILLDLLMPNADGYSVLDFLTSERPEAMRRVLVVTASLSSRQLERVRQYPICGLIAKPFEVEALHAAVKSCAELDDPGPFIRGPLLSGGMILLIAQMLRKI